MKRRLVRNPVVAMILVVAMIISLGTTVLSGIAWGATSTTADTTVASASATVEAAPTTPVVEEVVEPVAETPVVTDPIPVTEPSPVSEVVEPATPVAVETAPTVTPVETAPVDPIVTAPAKTIETPASAATSSATAVAYEPPCTLTGSVSPGSGVAGTIVTVNATSSGGTTGTLMIRWFEGAADTSWGNVSVLSGDYSVSVPLTVPADASLGTHTVKMWNGCQMYTTTFEVTAPTTPPTPTDPVIGDPATSPPTDPAVTPAPSQAVVTADTTPAQEEVVVSSSPVTGVNLGIILIYALVLGAAGILVLRRSQTKSAKH